MAIGTILLLLAIACFLIAAVGVPTGPVSAGWLGALFAALALLIARV